MIGKNEQVENNCSSSPDRIKLITEKREFLEVTSAQVQDDIKLCFKRLIDAIKSREKQLLRQVEAIHRQQLSLVQSNLNLHSSIPTLIVNLDKEEDLQKDVLQFGKVELSDNNCIINDAEPYKVEDYQEANKDHVSFDKELQFEKTKHPSNSDSRNDSFETKIVPSKSWNLNSTDFMNIQLIDEDFDESCVINPEISLMEMLECSMCSRDTESSMKERNFEIKEISVLVKNNENSRNNGEKTDCQKSHNVTADDSEHPKQVQQWLQQILIETETEPNVPEIEQFSEIPKSRVYADFPLET